ncbi:MAG: hypothetical protein IJ189_09305 [Clostridia bacterium]|nr:hypothetical protein [Clostridia bacterium]
MKKMLKQLALLTLALALMLTQVAFAESSDALQTVYDALVAEGSSFAQSKALYAEWYEDVTLDAALEGNSIVITQESANEWVESGKWIFTREGDALTLTAEAGDYNAAGMAMTVFEAVALSHGVNSSLLNGYVFGLGEENPYLTAETDESAGTTKYAISLNASYDFEGLDQMIMTGDTVYFFDALDEDYTSRGGNYGKVIMVINGNVHGVTLLVCEYGELDNVAYQDLVNAVSALKPDGWETFAAEYTELRDAETDAYSVVLNPDDAQVGEIIEDRYEGYSYAIVRIGQGE